MLSYLLCQFVIKIKITTTTKYFWKKLYMHYLKNKFLKETKMLHYDRINVSGENDINKSSASKE